MRSSSLRAGILGGLIGAVVGGGIMSAARPVLQTAPAPTSDALRAAFDDALAPLLDELRKDSGAARRPGRLHTAAAGRAAPERADADPVSTTPVPGGTREMPEARTPDSVDPLRPDTSVWTPPPNFERVRSVRGLGEDMRVRQRWLFVSERQALAEFGTPTSTWLSENSESWVYEEPDVETDDEIIHGATTTIVFSRGRLVQVYD